MSIWLRKRLAVWMGAALCGGALLWNVGASRAQNSGGSVAVLDFPFPRLKLTRDQATRNFVLLIEEEETRNRFSFGELTSADHALLSSISPKSVREINNGLGSLLLKMSEQWKQPQTAIRVGNETADTATVTLEADSALKSRPLILIQENGSWSVDVGETYAQWNGLEGVTKTEVVAQFAIAYNDAREKARRDSCQSNLKQIALGIKQYERDNNEKFPPANKWMDAVKPYVTSVGNEQWFQCPSQTTQGFGYAFNSLLSQKSPKNFPHLDSTVSVYDSTDSQRNASGLGENLAFRHQNGANTAFADGHVKWFPKTQTPSFKLKP